MGTTATSGFPSKAMTGKHTLIFFLKSCLHQGIVFPSFLAQFWMQAPRQRIQLFNGKWEKAVEISPFLKKRTQNFESKTLRDLLLSLFLESIFNTNYSNNNHVILRDGHLQSSAPRQEQMKLLSLSLRRKLSLCRSVCYGMGEGSSSLNSDFPSHSPKAASTG